MKVRAEMTRSRAATVRERFLRRQLGFEAPLPYGRGWESERGATFRRPQEIKVFGWLLTFMSRTQTGMRQGRRALREGR